MKLTIPKLRFRNKNNNFVTVFGCWGRWMATYCCHLWHHNTVQIVLCDAVPFQWIHSPQSSHDLLPAIHRILQFVHHFKTLPSLLTVWRVWTVLSNWLHSACRPKVRGTFKLTIRGMLRPRLPMDQRVYYQQDAFRYCRLPNSIVCAFTHITLEKVTDCLFNGRLAPRMKNQN